MLLAGCGHRVSVAPPSDNRLRDALVASPQTFDPALCQSVPNGQMLEQVFEGLVEYDAHNAIAPCLAKSWDISANGLTYTFHLRPGVKFQDGSSLTADDVAYSLARPLYPQLASPVALEYLGDIVGAKAVADGKAQMLSGVQVIDPETVSVTISSPKAYWIDTLTYCTDWIVEKKAVAKLGLRPLGIADDVTGIGTGPFKLTRYVPDSEVDMDASPDYWGGAPKIAGVVDKIVTDPNTRHAEFADGQVDIMRDEEFGNYVGDNRDPALKSSLHVYPRSELYYLALNINVYPPFRDVRVRQAFAYAMDKVTLSKRATAGLYPPSQDFLPTGMPGYDPNFQGLPYDPAKAKSLLAQAGYPGGKGLPPLDIYVYNNRPFAQGAVDLLRQMYQSVGIPVKIRQMEFGALIAAVDRNTQLPCFFFGWSADYLDPQDFYSLLFSSKSPENHTGYKNSALDALCARADTAQNPKERMAMYRQAAQIIRDDAPRIPIFVASDPELDKPYIHGLEDGLTGHLPYRNVTLH